MVKRAKLSTLKKRAWKAFSEYIRKKYAINGYVYCCTCGERKHWKEMHAGHYIHNRLNIYFDERNVHPQCNKCNTFLHGNGRMYERFMRDTYGEEVIEELETLKNVTIKLSRKDYLEIESEYKNKPV